jgi:hypothetical protein
MHFKTRYDKWIVVVLGAVSLLMLAMPCVMYITASMRAGQLWMFLVGPMVMLFALSATLPQYYDVRQDGLLIRQGWKRVLLRYPNLRQLRAETGVLAAPVFSTHRIYLSAVPGGDWILAVAEQERFLDEVQARAPQLTRGPSGLQRSGSSGWWK